MFRKHNETKQRFTIKKYSFGAASVLIGIFFAGAVAQAEEVQPVKPEATVATLTASAPAPTAAIETIAAATVAPKAEVTTTAAPATTAAPVVTEAPKTEAATTVAPATTEAPKAETTTTAAPATTEAPKAETTTAAAPKAEATRTVGAQYKVTYTDVATKEVVFTTPVKSASSTTTEPATVKATVVKEVKAEEVGTGVLADYRLADDQGESVLLKALENTSKNTVNFNVVKNTLATPLRKEEDAPVLEGSKFFSAVDETFQEDVNGLTVTAKGEITEDGKPVPKTTISVDVKIPTDKYKAGDTLQIRFENLFRGVKIDPIMYLNTTDKKYIYATVDNTSGVDQDLIKVNTSAGTSEIQAKNDKTTLEEKLAADIKFDGADVIYTYTFNKNVEGLDGLGFNFEVTDESVNVPRVAEDKELVGKVYIDGTEVLNLPYTVGKTTGVTGTSGAFDVDNNGTIYLNKDGSIARVETTVSMVMGENSLPVGGTFTTTLADPTFSKFVSTGPTGPFAILPTSYPLQANEHGVLLNTTGGKITKLQVTNVTDTSVTFEVVEGELLANTGYRFFLQGNNPDKGARRVFSAETLENLKKAIEAKATSISSPAGSTTSATGLTTADGTESIAPEGTVQWGIRYPSDFTGGSTGFEKQQEGELIVRYVTADTGLEILDPSVVVHIQEGVLSGTDLNLDNFKTTAPARDFKDIATDATDKLEPGVTEDGGVTTYDVKAPYIVQAADGKLYQFIGYSTASIFKNTQTSGLITADQTNVVAQYVPLAYGTVRVNYLDDRGTVLKPAVGTKYNGKADADHTNAVGNKYDVTGEAGVTTRPETIDANGFTYYLETEPKNLTGNLTADIINVDYIYKPGQKANIVFKKEGETTALSTVTEKGKSSSTISQDAYKAELKKYLDQNYVVVTDAFEADATKTFDKDAAKDQNFDVVLKEKVIDITDPNDPNLPQEVKDQIAKDGGLTEVVNQTVKFVEKANEANELEKAETDKVEFTRAAKYNMVTKKLEYTKWTAKDNDVLEAKKAKVVTGFLAETAEVPAVTVAATDADRTDLIKYVPIGKYIIEVPGKDPIEEPYKNNPNDPTAIDPNAPVTIPYVEGYTPKDGNGNDLPQVDPNDPTKGYVAPTPPADGKPNTTIKYEAEDQVAIITFELQDEKGAVKETVTVTENGKTAGVISKDAYAAKLAEYDKAGYEVVTDEFKTALDNNTAVYDTKTGVDQNFKVVLKERVIKITPDAEPGQPIDKDKPNGPVWPDSIKDVLEEEEVVRTIKYLVDGTEDAARRVEDKLGYHRAVTVNLVNLVTTVVHQGEWTPNTTDAFAEVKSPVITGYLADRATVEAKTGVQATDADINEEVKYTPIGKFVITNPDGSTTETPYKNDPTDPTKADPNDKPTIPYVPGFTPKDGNGNDLPPVDPNDPTKGYILPPAPTDGKPNTGIKYEADPQTANIIFEDEKGTELTKVTEKGTSTEPIPTTNYTTELEKLVNQGYEVVTDGFKDSDKTFDTDAKVDQEFKVVVKPRVIEVPKDAKPGQPVDPNNPNGPKWPAGVDQLVITEEVNQTVTFEKEDGTEAAPKVTDKVTFTRVPSVNLVTGEVTYGPWTADNGDTTFDAKKVPVVNGFVADKKEVPAVENITGDQADDVQKVTYKPIAKFVVTKPDGSTEEVPYKNDPTDPTAIDTTDKPNIPYVPGYVPTDGNGNPLKPVDENDPTKGYIAPTPPTDGGTDTPVKYVPTDATKFEPNVGEVVVKEDTPITDKDITDKVTIPGLDKDTPGLEITVKGNIPGTDLPDGTVETVEVPVKVTPKPVETAKGTGLVADEKPEANLPVAKPEVKETSKPIAKPEVKAPAKKAVSKPVVKAPAKKAVAKPAAKKAVAGALPKTSAAGTETNSALPAGLAAVLAAAGLVASKRRRKED